jgi:hypothetical protein
MKVMNLQATFEARAAAKKAYEKIEKITNNLNKEVDSFIKERIDAFIMDKFNLSDREECFQYIGFVSQKSGDSIEEFFLSDEFIFRIRKKTEQIGEEVVVSFIYEL